MSNNIIFIFLSIYTFVTLVFFGTDVYFWFTDRYSRYRIGRWKNKEQWAHKVLNKAINWLPNVPSIPVTENKHLILLDILLGNYKRASVQAWQTAGLLLGVQAFPGKISKMKKKKTLNKYIDHNGCWKKVPTNVDYAMLAYAFLKNSNNPNKIKPAMDSMIAVISQHIGKNGLIYYTKNNPLLFVDTIGLVCPFLVLYAEKYNEPKYSLLSFRQIQKFNEIGLFNDTMLPVHAFMSESHLPVGVYGWGRGSGWFLLGLIDSFLEMNVSKEKEQLYLLIEKSAKYYLQFEKDDGGFGVFIQNPVTYDSSATAVFAYFYGRCFEIFKEKKYFDLLERSLTKLTKYTRITGSVDYCQGDTINVGIFSSRLDILPFAQGMTLRAYAIYKTYM